MRCPPQAPQAPARPLSVLALALGPLVAAPLVGCASPPDAADSEVGDEAEDSGESDSAPEDGAADGTADESDSADTSAEALRPNWHQDIAPLVHANCVGCHVQGGIGPFGLEEYAQAAPFAPLMADAVHDGLMPPWGATETEECEPEHDWANDLRLPAEAIESFVEWADNGAPEGDPADAVPLPAPPNLGLQGTSATFQNPSPFEVTGPEDSFICYSVDPGLDQDVWVTGVQLVPDNEAVVHHVLIYSDPNANSAEVAGPDGSYPCFGTAGVDDANLMGTWVPGAVPTELPADIGLSLPAGSRIILAYHYHPTGEGAQVDQSALDIRWTEDPPAYEGQISLLGNVPAGDNLLPGPNDPSEPVFWIPAGEPAHTETMQYTIPNGVPPIDLFSLATHMHYVGTDMRVTIERDGEELCFIQTPRWDFNWQRVYTIEGSIGQFPKVQGGDVVTMRCTYDNTLNNPALVSALAESGLSEPVDVSIGDTSLEEMCLLIFGVAFPNLP